MSGRGKGGKGLGKGGIKRHKKTIEEFVSKKENPPNINILNGVNITICSNSSLSAIDSNTLNDILKQNGGKFFNSYLNNITHLICSENDKDSIRIDKARKNGIFIVSEDWILDCVDSNSKVDEKYYRPQFIVEMDNREGIIFDGSFGGNQGMKMVGGNWKAKGEDYSESDDYSEEIPKKPKSKATKKGKKESYNEDYYDDHDDYAEGEGEYDDYSEEIPKKPKSKETKKKKEESSDDYDDHDDYAEGEGEYDDYSEEIPKKPKSKETKNVKKEYSDEEDDDDEEDEYAEGEGYDLSFEDKPSSKPNKSHPNQSNIDEWNWNPLGTRLSSFGSIRKHVSRYNPSNDIQFEDYEILRTDILQMTEFGANKNKYYCLELHKSITTINYRVFSHYGRTDDIMNNPNSGRKEIRSCSDLHDARYTYQTLYLEKISKRKGYKLLELSSANVGSEKARINKEKKNKVSQSTSQSNLHPAVHDLISYIYEECSNAITNVVQCKISQNGIETPLGVLQLPTILQGEEVLDLLQKELLSGNPKEETLEDLSSKFYTLIPHRFGRSRTEAQKAIISTYAMYEDKKELLQLMKDIVSVIQKSSSSLSEIDLKYHSLGCDITPLTKHDFEFARIEKHVIGSQVKTKDIKVLRIFKISKESEVSRFKSSFSNNQLLFHGTRPSSVFGIMGRGLLMPKHIEGLGVQRTDVGMLGFGLYYGNAACTSAFYAKPGTRQTRFIFLADVALGNIYQTNKITKGITSPPFGYESVQGTRKTFFNPSDFEDDEFVIYNKDQQKLSYLVEICREGIDNVVDEQSIIDSASLSFPQLPVPSLNFDQNKSCGDSSIESEDLSDVSPEPVPTSKKAPKKTVKKKMPKMKKPAKKKPSRREKKTKAKIPRRRRRKARDFFAASESDSFYEEEFDNYNIISYEEALQNIHPRIVSESKFSLGSEKEENIRKLFANDRDNWSLSDKYLLLIDVFSNISSFVYKKPQLPNDVPIILKRFEDSAYPVGSPSIVQNKEMFFENWESFSCGMFKDFDFSNIFIAGGSVNCSLEPNLKKESYTNDIDLFLYDLSPSQATEKVTYIYNMIKKNTNGEGNVIRTKNAITILNVFPYRHIQIVLRIYKSPAEVLIGFDIDSCCVGFDGSKVWMLPRAQRAINERYNLIDLTRRSLTYEIRLNKYSKRGFAVAVPGLQLNAVNPQIYSYNIHHLKGLAKLLVLNNNSLRESGKTHIGKDINYVAPYLPKKNSGDNQESDYNIFSIPWNENWRSTYFIVSMFIRRDKSHYFSEKRKGTKSVPPIVVTSLDGVLTGKRSWTHFNQKFEPLSDYDPKDKYVRGELVKGWLLKNPGQQLLTGSFSPVYDNNWEEGVYSDVKVVPVSKNISSLLPHPSFSNPPTANTFNNMNNNNNFDNNKIINNNNNNSLFGSANNNFNNNNNNLFGSVSNNNNFGNNNNNINNNLFGTLNENNNFSSFNFNPNQGWNKEEEDFNSHFSNMDISEQKAPLIPPPQIEIPNLLSFQSNEGRNLSPLKENRNPFLKKKKKTPRTPQTNNEPFGFILQNQDPLIQKDPPVQVSKSFPTKEILPNHKSSKEANFTNEILSVISSHEFSEDYDAQSFFLIDYLYENKVIGALSKQKLLSFAMKSDKRLFACIKVFRYSKNFRNLVDKLKKFSEPESDNKLFGLFPHLFV